MQDEHAEEGAYNRFGKIGSSHKKTTIQDAIDSVHNEMDRLHDAYLKQMLNLVQKKEI